MYRKSLLLSPMPRFLQIIQGRLPRGMALNEGVIAEGVIDPLDVHLGHLVRGQVVRPYVLGRHPQIPDLGYAERIIDVGRIA